MSGHNSEDEDLNDPYLQRVMGRQQAPDLGQINFTRRAPPAQEAGHEQQEQDLATSSQAEDKEERKNPEDPLFYAVSRAARSNAESEW